MLCHALRVAWDQPLYGPPSVDFIPYLYTPLYPWLVAKLGGISGIGYLLGRAISLFALAGMMVLAYVYARRCGGSRATAAVAPGIIAAAYVPTGAWYDLARPDTLALFFITAGMLCGYWGRRRPAAVVAAALLMVAAFFTKQTASPFMVGLAIVLLATSWRAALLYGATLAIAGLPALWWANKTTDGWFWTYVFRLHQMHDFYALRAFVGSPVRLLLMLGPAVLLVPWALMRRRTPDLVFALVLALIGVAASCLGYGTQWAFTNAFIPGILFPAIAIAAAAGRLTIVGPTEHMPRLRPLVVYALLIPTLIMSTGILLPWAKSQQPLAKKLGLPDDEPTLRDLKTFIPTARDRAAGDALVQKLAATPGEVLVPFHPFYAHLAGKRTYLHRMGVMDVGRAGMGAPRGLGQALTEKRFSLVVMDNKIDGTWFQWPGFIGNYHVVGHVDGPRARSRARRPNRATCTSRSRRRLRLSPSRKESDPREARAPLCRRRDRRRVARGRARNLSAARRRHRRRLEGRVRLRPRRTLPSTISSCSRRNGSIKSDGSGSATRCRSRWSRAPTPMRSATCGRLAVHGAQSPETKALASRRDADLRSRHDAALSAHAHERRARSSSPPSATRA